MPILEWLNKEEAVKTAKMLPYKILKVKTEFSYGEQTENMIIKGDNLEVLQALLPYYKGQIKCIYIDPPYNTGSRIDVDGFEISYNDNLEHSIWCSMMYPRLELLKKFLKKDGLLAVQIDDDEFCHLYMIMEELFGSKNLKTISVKMSEPTGVKMASIKKSGGIPKLKEYIILASPNGIKNLHIEQIPKEKWDQEYKTVLLNISKNSLSFIKQVLENEDRTQKDIEEVRSLVKNIEFKSVSEVCKEETGKKISDEWLYANAFRIVQIATLTGGAKNLAEKEKANTSCIEEPCIKITEDWLYDNAYRIVRLAAVTGGARTLAEKEKAKTTNDVGAFPIITPQKKMYLIKRNFNENTPLPRCKILFADQYLTVHPGDFWQDIKTTGLENEGGVVFLKSKKPEALIKRIIGMCTEEGDFVMDSFLGSGTTCAVAHKMKRKYIGIEQGSYIYSHTIKRLKNVIDGEQQGISKAVNWKGGGGYVFYELGETIFDEDGNINRSVDFTALAAHIWFMETKTPFLTNEKSPFLGVYNGTAYYLLFNGILGDKKSSVGNVLTKKVLNMLPQYEGFKVIYGEASRITPEKLKVSNIIFKQIPYEVSAR